MIHTPNTAPDAPANPDQSRPSNPTIYRVLRGQPALVIGANSGIGKAVALGLAQTDADVIINKKRILGTYTQSSSVDWLGLEKDRQRTAVAGFHQRLTTPANSAKIMALFPDPVF